MFKTFALILTLTLVTAHPGAGALVFSDDFNSGTTGNWYKGGTSGSLSNPGTSLNWAENGTGGAEVCAPMGSRKLSRSDRVRLTRRRRAASRPLPHDDPEESRHPGIARHHIVATTTLSPESVVLFGHAFSPVRRHSRL